MSEQEVCKLVTGMLSETCELDCVPIWLVKEHLNVFLPSVTDVINSSFSSAVLYQNNLIEVYQSAYVSKRSTETALLKVQSDILNAVDRQEVVFLVMLDLSAAFDTIDRIMLLQHLQNNFGISGKSLQWIRSFLESRVYQVQIDSVLSDMYSLDFGVPQGSVLGPLGFILYTSLVGNIIRKHGLTSMSMPMTHKCTSSLIQEY